MSGLPLLRPAPATGANLGAMVSCLPAVGGIGIKATDPKTTVGALVTVSETRQNNCRAATTEINMSIWCHRTPYILTSCQTLPAANGNMLNMWTVWRAVVEMPKSEVGDLQGHGHSRQRPHPTLGWGMASTSCQTLVANCWPLAAQGCCRPLAARVNLGGAKVVLPKRQQSHNRRGAPLNSGWVGAAYRTLEEQIPPLAARM